MRMLRRDLLKAASAAAAGKLPEASVKGADNAAQAEARGTWLHLPNLPADRDRGTETLHAIVQNLAESNFNLVLPWMPTDYLSAVLGDAEFRKKYPNTGWDAMEIGRAS